MFGELPKLFDRNFAVGFFLPMAILISFSVVMFCGYTFSGDVFLFLEYDLIITTTILGLLSWAGGILLLAINRDLYRFLEGYGTYNPLKLFGWFEKKRYRSILKNRANLENEFSECMIKKIDFPVKSMLKRRKLVKLLAVDFPDQEVFLLPTPFGNALRSFETYSRVMYGLDSIPAWTRLLAIIPKEYLEMIDGAKAHVDFWVNLGLVFILLQIEYVGLVFATGSILNWWIVGMWIMLGTIAPLRATSSAREWGNYVKSAFDVFIPKLRDTLGIRVPKNRQKEFVQWQKFSQALIFRLPEQLPELKCVEKSRSDG